MGRLSLLGEIWAFLRVRKKWWLTPIIFVLILFGLAVALAQTAVSTPFIYTLF
jgi:hypothetical protein